MFVWSLLAANYAKWEKEVSKSKKTGCDVSEVVPVIECAHQLQSEQQYTSDSQNYFNCCKLCVVDLMLSIAALASACNVLILL